MSSKRKWAAALAAIALIVIGSVPWRIWGAGPARELAALGRAATGFDAQASERTTIRLLPQPAITFHNVTLASPDRAVKLTIEQLRGDLRLNAMLGGGLEFAALRIINPVLNIEADAIEDVAARLRAFAAYAGSGGVRPEVLEITGGRARISAAGTPRQFENVQALLRWESDEAAAISGGFSVQGEKFALEALIAKPLSLLRGDDSPFTLKIVSRIVDLSLNGILSGGARWLMEARIAATSERLQPLLALLDLRPPMPGRLGRFALSGQMRALPQTASLSDMKLALDANSFDGSLSLRIDEGRPKLSGTLAARSLEFSTRDLGLHSLNGTRHRGQGKSWNREPLGSPNLAFFDADLRVSAAKARFGRFALTEAGVLIKLTDGALEAIIADSQAYGGKLRGRVTLQADLQPSPSSLSLTITTTFANIESGRMLRDLAGASQLQGAASGEMRLAAKGGSIFALMNDLQGSARAAISKGELVGLNIEQAMRRAERRPLSIPSDMRSGQTTFVSAELEARVDSGAMTINTARILGPGVEMNAAGGAELGERTLRLSVAAAPPRTHAGVSREPVLLLDIAGAWDDLRLSLDAENLIFRSRAAAPLLPRPEPPLPIRIEPTDLAPAAIPASDGQ